VLALLQRVAEARVEIDGRIVGRVGQGLLLFVCAEPDDTERIADKLVDKVLRLRVFADAAGKMNLDLAAVGGGLLVVSQFTLAADTSAGNRPGFFRALPARSSGGGSTTGCWRRPLRATATSRTASSAPT
jgi:D-tyrosyl-tRNA(Tyr) deacylase